MQKKRFYTYRIRLCVAALLTAMFFSSIPASRVEAAAGDLDLTFGNSGKVTTDFFANFDSANAVAVQPDGKIVAGGVAEVPGGNADFGLARYNSNGVLDPAFGSGGKVNTDFTGFSDAVRSVVIQPDGKIVAGGITTGGDGHSDFALARYNSNGSVDLSFGSGGRVTTDFLATDTVNAIALQPDGKIVAVGEARDERDQSDFGIVRYNGDGSLDTTFDSDGKLITNFSGFFDRATDLVINPDGKIVVAGDAAINGGPFDFAVARYNPNGSLDVTFGSGGKVSTNFFGGFDGQPSINRQPDGKLVVVGFALSSISGTAIGIARYNSDGSPDSTFGVGGKLPQFVDVSPSGSDILPDGKIVVGGTAADLIGTDFAVVRFNNDGSLDTTFGSGGKTVTDFSFGFADQVNAIALQPDGKIILAGNSTSQGFFDFALARYDGDGGSFNICLQDDRNGNVLQFNSETGDYQFKDCRKGFMFSGRGTVRIRACKVELQDFQRDRNLSVLANTCTHVGAVSLQVSSPARSFTISDSDITNNMCGCR